MAKGIFTAARVFPSKGTNVVTRDGNVLAIGGNKFTVDYGCDVGTSQNQIFANSSSSVASDALKGYSTTLLFTGPDYSQRILTSFGNEDDVGLVPRIAATLFQSISTLVKKPQVSLSFIGIDETQIYDFLTPHNRIIKPLEINSMGIVSENSSRIIISSAETLSELVYQSVRTKDALLASRTSKTHSILSIELFSQDEKSTTIARINFVVLADSAAANSPTSLKNLWQSFKTTQEKQSASSLLVRLLQREINANTNIILFLLIDADEKFAEESQYSLNLLKIFEGFEVKNNQINVEIESIVSKVREDLMALQGSIGVDTASTEQVNQLQNKTSELEYLKSLTIDARIALSSQFENERNSILIEKGLHRIIQQQPRDIKSYFKDQGEKDILNNRYTQQKSSVEKIKNELQAMILEFSQLQESKSLDEATSAEKVAAIELLKEKLRLENEELKSTRAQLKALLQQQQQEKQPAPLVQSLDVQTKLVKEEGESLESVRETAIKVTKDEIRMKYDQERLVMQILAMNKEPLVPVQQLIDAEVQVVKLQEEKEILTLSLTQNEQSLKQTQETANRTIEIYKKELELQQLQHFQTFRLYRNSVEEYKQSLKSQYVDLLDKSVRDSVYLSARNKDLEEEVSRLKAELAQKSQ